MYYYAHGEKSRNINMLDVKSVSIGFRKMLNTCKKFTHNSLKMLMFGQG